MPPPGRLGEVNADLEASMLHDAYQVEPDPLGQTVSTPLQTREIPIPEAPGVVPGGLDSRKFISVLERAYGKPIIRNILVPPAVAGQAPVRLDSGRGNRAEITLHNLGDFDLWFAYSQQMTVGNAELLPGAPVPGSLLGGFISIALRTDVEVWVLAAAAAPAAGIMIVVSEFGL
jgi:hypothetical protein